MTDKPDLSWYPTTIEELQRLLASGVWPRVRAIADAGPFHRVQGLLTRIDTDGGMNGIWEGSASAGVVPIDSIWLQRYPTTGETGVGARSLWLWRAEATEPAKREHTMVLRLDKPPRFEQSASIEKALGLLPLIEEALALLSPVLRSDDDQIVIARAADALQHIARAVGLDRYADDIFTIMKAADTIAGLVDRLVETDPEYIEQLRRSGS